MQSSLALIVGPGSDENSRRGLKGRSLSLTPSPAWRTWIKVKKPKPGVYAFRRSNGVADTLKSAFQRSRCRRGDHPLPSAAVQTAVRKSPLRILRRLGSPRRPSLLPGVPASMPIKRLFSRGPEVLCAFKQSGPTPRNCVRRRIENRCLCEAHRDCSLCRGMSFLIEASDIGGIDARSAGEWGRGTAKKTERGY